MACLINAGVESKVLERFSIKRDVTKDAYYAYTGYQDGHGFWAMCQSMPQLKLVILSAVWYVFQTKAYMVLANYLILITFHDIPEDNADYPGAISANGTNTFQKKELYDPGFQLTPDWSHRPWWLKAAFVDSCVMMAQFLVPLIIFCNGWTFELVRYTGNIGIMNIMKGLIAIMTVLPPARQGQECWELNFKNETLQAIREEPFSDWFLQDWGMMHGCNDMLWSGHTSQTCLGLLFIEQTMRKCGCPFVVRFLLFIFFCGYVWAVLACRMHYTIDVVCAALVATALYTHPSLSQLIWALANTIVCNPVGEESKTVSQQNSGVAGEDENKGLLC